MLGPTRIDLIAAVRTQPPVDVLALRWLCPICGKLRVFEGGRPMFGDRDECQECGSALFAPKSHARPSSGRAWDGETPRPLPSR
jgi:hypothetical protein